MRAIQIVDWFGWRMSQRIRVNGLQIGIWDDDYRTLADKVADALNLIKIYDPRRHKILLRDLERIWVLLLPGPRASFHVDTWCCRLDERFIRDAPVEKIASVIVHEATHARLFRRGIGYRENLRHRVEAVCIRQQIVFSAKIPTGEEAKSEAESSLKLDPSRWTDNAFARRHTRGSIEALRHLGTPNWIVLAVLRLHRRRRRYRLFESRRH